MSKKFFPELAVGFEDPRVHLHVGDGIFNATIFFYLFDQKFSLNWILYLACYPNHISFIA